MIYNNLNDMENDTYCYYLRDKVLIAFSRIVEKNINK